MSKSVILIRHGYPNDSEDPVKERLSDEGSRDVKRLSGLYNEFREQERDIIGMSGLILCGTTPRCRETARILAENSRYPDPVPVPSLNMGFIAEIFDDIKTVTSDDFSHLILVSHESTLRTWSDMCKNGKEFQSFGYASGMLIRFDDWNNISFLSLMKKNIAFSLSPKAIQPL